MPEDFEEDEPLLLPVPGAVPAEPVALVWFAREPGVRLRVALWRTTRARRGLVVVLPGFAEYLEKYLPTVAELLARGFDVLAADWRGHGLSSRLVPEPRRGWVASFDDYLADLRAVLAAHASDGPRVLLAHSMGGHLGLRLLQEDATTFERAVLLAPMLRLATPFPLPVVRAIAALHCALGLGAWTSWDGDLSPERSGTKLTGSPERLEALRTIVAEHPALRVDRVTWRWLREAARSLALVREPARLAAHRTPTLLLSATADRVVDPRGHRWFADRVPAIALVRIEGAAHELLQEREKLRGRAWAAIDSFLATK